MSTAAQDIPRIGPEVPQAEIDRIFAAQQARAIELRTSTAAERIARLKKLKQIVMDYEDDMLKAGHADFKKPAFEVGLTENLPIIAEINHTIKHIKKWMKPKRVKPTMLMFGNVGKVHLEPKGVSLIIAPWNYPANLSLMPLVSAIATGCTAILKPSEMTPNISGLVEKMIHENFPENEVYVFQGAVEVSTALLAKPFDHIFFTGSPAIGKVVMEAASKHLTSVTLELGGKSPTIVDETADIKNAAKSICYGKFLNCGQTCIAPDHLYVHESVKDQFVAECKEALKTFYGDDKKATPDYARMVNNRHYGRVVSLLDEARQRGATVLTGGDTDGEQDYIEPTLVESKLGEQTPIMQQEIFGPLLPVISYTDLTEVINDINGRPKPLALYIYSKNRRNKDRLLKNTTAGGTCINTCTIQYLHMNLPFGGVNNSGIGNSHSIWGFKAFSHERAVVEDKFSSTLLFAPPYTPFLKKLMAILIRWGV